MNPPLALTEAQRLAEKARQGLRMVAAGEHYAMKGWLEYGQALLAGGKLHTKPDGTEDDYNFGKWKRETLEQVVLDIHAPDEQAAMWAAGEADFWAFRRIHLRVRTVRGLHAKWKDAQRPQAEPEQAREVPTEAERKTVDHFGHFELLVQKLPGTLG